HLPVSLLLSQSGHLPTTVAHILHISLLKSSKEEPKQKMQIHKLSLTNYSLTIPCPHIYPSLGTQHQPTKLVSPPIFTFRFCTSLKRVFKSQTSLRKYGNLIRVRCGLEGLKDDGFYMRMGVELARKAIGCTSPNPMVGCVIVKDGKIVGQGFHPKAGQPHAEVFALRDAGDLAENATAYVTLEPCNHFGRTPPCTEALIKAKVKRVVVGMVDPNPIVASKGLDRLRDAGIDVTVGIEEELCKRLNEAYIHQMLTGKPFVTLRYTLSVNGIFLNQLGEGVTESGGYYSQLLQEYDTIIISASLADKFSVSSSSEPSANRPLWIITASNPSLPVQLPVLTKETASRLIVFTDKERAVEPEMTQKGIETVVLDRLSLTAILEYSKQCGSCSVLLDLRGSLGDFEELLREGIEQNLLQKIVLEVLPVWSESESGFPLVLNSLGERLKLKSLQPKFSNQSVLVEGYF
ncbi:dCMP_cyt_deam_1 domain-containing protein, partial [Cephalotus follicularis]